MYGDEDLELPPSRVFPRFEFLFPWPFPIPDLADLDLELLLCLGDLPEFSEEEFWSWVSTVLSAGRFLESMLVFAIGTVKMDELTNLAVDRSLRFRLGPSLCVWSSVTLEGFKLPVAAILEIPYRLGWRNQVPFQTEQKLRNSRCGIPRCPMKSARIVEAVARDVCFVM